jgi:hypothetical protein
VEVRLRAHRRRLLALAAAVVVAIVGVIVYSEASAPNPFLPSRSMMIGTWQSASGAVITLRPDGTFTARGLPANAGESAYGTVPSGSWRVGPVHAEPSGVIFDFSPAVQMELLVERVSSRVSMYYDKGDPDEGVSGQYQFTKLR